MTQPEREIHALDALLDASNAQAIAAAKARASTARITPSSAARRTALAIALTAPGAAMPEQPAPVPQSATTQPRQ